jgi:hypothetical protein
MKFLALLIAVGAFTVGTTQKASAHARWVEPVPRDNSTGHKNEMFPCGGQPARADTQAVTTLAPGATYMFRFEETITHPGCFLVDISMAGEANWQPLANVKHVNTPPNPSAQAPRPYMLSVTLPNMTCTDCTLRVRQVMMDRAGGEDAPCPPDPLANVPTYFSCANIVLAGAAPSTAAPATPGAPAPAAAPAPPGDSGESALGCSIASGSQASLAGLASCFLVAGLITLAARRRRRSE